MELFIEFILGVFILLLGFFVFKYYKKKIKEVNGNDNLWVTRLDILISAIMLLILGFIAIIDVIYELIN